MNAPLQTGSVCFACSVVARTQSSVVSGTRVGAPGAAMPVGDERGAIMAERVAIRAVARVAYDRFASAFIA